MTIGQNVDLNDRRFYVSGTRCANFTYVDGRDPRRPVRSITNSLDYGYFGTMLSDRGMDEIVAMTKAFAKRNNGKFVLLPASHKGQDHDVVFVSNEPDSLRQVENDSSPGL
jgi:hypothetical protein